MNKSMLYAGLLVFSSANTNAAMDTVNLSHEILASSAQAGSLNLASNDLQPKQVLAAQGAAPNNTQGTQTTGSQTVTTQTQAPAQATSTQTGTQTTTTTQGSAIQNSSAPATTVTTTPQVVPAQTQQTTTITTQPATTTITTQPATVPVPTAKTSISIQKINAPKMDCNYHIPAETTHVDKSIVLQWAGNAAAQSFDFDNTTMDSQLAALKPCYTDLGWQGFNDALQKSGNLDAIKNQKLMVSSMVSGPLQITEVKENQWKVNVPLQVVYQNDQQKLTQSLMVNLLIGRKVSGDLGIMQMIAVPRKPLEQTVPGTSSTTVTVPASTTQP
ncbi:DotI/IcmL family type IV secretion protein [Legionella jordanis]|uniref:DotI/IcmL family type IV secretion protein n=1 Tax=Legionella jordanis TaxID=456 RepID=UPI001F2D3EB5|nr:DotI/IcmL family type IV secretion protein [Legionella jordanis]